MMGHKEYQPLPERICEYPVIVPKHRKYGHMRFSYHKLKSKISRRNRRKLRQELRQQFPALAY